MNLFFLGSGKALGLWTMNKPNRVHRMCDSSPIRISEWTHDITEYTKLFRCGGSILLQLDEQNLLPNENFLKRKRVFVELTHLVESIVHLFHRKASDCHYSLNIHRSVWIFEFCWKVWCDIIGNVFSYIYTIIWVDYSQRWCTTKIWSEFSANPNESCAYVWVFST